MCYDFFFLSSLIKIAFKTLLKCVKISTLLGEVWIKTSIVLDNDKTCYF